MSLCLSTQIDEISRRRLRLPVLWTWFVASVNLSMYLYLCIWAYTYLYICIFICVLVYLPTQTQYQALWHSLDLRLMRKFILPALEFCIWYFLYFFLSFCASYRASDLARSGGCYAMPWPLSKPAAESEWLCRSCSILFWRRGLPNVAMEQPLSHRWFNYNQLALYFICF